MMRIIRTKTILLLAMFMYLASCGEKKPTDNRLVSENNKPVNIILLIGDGMGLSQVSSTFYFKKDGPSNFQRFRHIGLINTSSASARITDSAAGATAFACGELTYNGAIGVNPDKQPVPNIVEFVSEFGYRSGLVATSSITHATPASFYAHVESRSMNESIAEQLIESDVDLFIGGGRDYFDKREDGQNLNQELSSNGFDMFYSLDTLPEMDGSRKYGVLAAPDGLPSAGEGRGNFLPHATETALKYLSSGDQPFFLMIEGSQIDWGGHDNDSAYVISEMLDFDRTIEKALDFAENNGETLVIVTADHETGGFALSSDPGDGMSSDYNKLNTTFSTDGHTATLIPVFASGPGADVFGGIYKNTEIYHKMIQLLDLGELKRNIDELEAISRE